MSKHHDFSHSLYEEWITAEQERLSGLFFDAVSALITELEAAGDLSGALGHARHAVSVDRLREDGHQHLIRLLAASGQPGAALRQYRELERLLDEELAEEPSAPLRALARQIEKQSGLAVPPAAAPSVPVSSPSALPPSRASQPHLPDTVTFLLSDIEGSTRQWERAGEAFKSALETHHRLLRVEFARFGGQEVKEAGDAFVVAFGSARKALDCAVACQQALAREAWPEGFESLAVRMALHTGDMELKDGEYHGLVLHRASRMLTAAHGGQVLLSETTASLVRRDLSEDVRLVDLGVYRLRDVPVPERLFQVEHKGMAQATFGPLNAEAGHPSSLPLRFTRFFGREQEIAALRDMALDPQVRLLTVTGPGGTGKTRLALEVAERLAGQLEGAVWFAPLADLADPGLIASAVLDALRVPRSPQREPLEQVVEALSRQPSLLVLDNFEQLVEGGAQIVQTLMARIPSLTLLVTSRQVLGLPGEREFALSPLPTPNGVDTPEGLSVFDSVRLFIDRAQAARPDFQVTAANAPAIAALCDGLEGIPLAIELAAARALVLTPSQMLGQLSSRFEFLTSRQRGVNDRQRTLRGAVDWSYRLLAPELQRFFMRLSVFRGGWTAEAAETVCEEPLALDYLADLRESSLALSEEDNTGMRFRMLETLRDFGAEQLTADERAVLQRRHADFFVALAETARPLLRGPEQAQWLDRLESDHDNLRAAMERGGPEAALQIAGAIQWFWDVRGYLSEGRARLEKALADTDAETPSPLRGRALAAAANLAWAQGDFGAAGASYEESLALYRQLGNKSGIAASLSNLGNIAIYQGDRAAARSLLEESLAAYRDIDNKQGIAGVLNSLGGITTDLAAMRALIEEGLSLFRELGDTRGTASALHNLGNVAIGQGDYEAARPIVEETLALHRALGYKEGIALSFQNRGNIALEQGDYAAAATAHEEGLALHRALGDKPGIALSLLNLGHVSRCQGDNAAARALFEESSALFREVGEKKYVVEALVSLTDIARRQGDSSAARTLLTESLTLHRELEDEPGSAVLLEAWAALASAQNQPRRAATLWGAAAALRAAAGTPLPPSARADYDGQATQVRTALGEEPFRAAFAAGRAFTWQEAIAFALEEQEQA